MDIISKMQNMSPAVKQLLGKFYFEFRHAFNFFVLEIKKLVLLGVKSCGVLR